MQVIKTAARRAATNALTRLFTGLLRPPKHQSTKELTEGMKFPPLVEGKTLSHMKRRITDRIRPAPPPPPRKMFGNMFYVACCNGFLTYHFDEEQGCDRYDIVSNVRAATPFPTFTAANKHGKHYVEYYLDKQNHYYAVLRPA